MSDVTTVTLENKYRRVSIQVPGSDIDSEGMKDGVFKPLMLAIGFHPNNVNELFGEE